MDGNDKCLDEGTFITHPLLQMHQNSEKESGSKIFKWKQALTKYFLTYSPKFLTQISRLTFPRDHRPRFLPAYDVTMHALKVVPKQREKVEYEREKHAGSGD